MRGVFLLLVVTVAGVLSVPTDRHTVKKRASNLPIIPGDEDANSLGMLKYKKWRLEPVEVKQIESYKHDKPKQNKRMPSLPSQHTFSEMSSAQSSYSNLNGNIATTNEQRHKANEDGQLLDSFHHSGAGQAYKGKPAHTQELTELKVPSMGLNDRVLERDGQMVQEQENAQESEEERVLQVSSVLAGYIRQTGDEAGVAEYIKQMLTRGQMREDEALMYLNTIQALLSRDKLLTREKEEEEEVERENEAQLMLNFSDYLDRKFENGEMPQPVYKELKDRLMESVLEKAETDPQFLAIPQEPFY